MLTFIKLLKQVRSQRGTLASKTRSVIFATFGDNNLPTINTNASPAEISKWKKKPEVATCYKRLFEKSDSANENSPLLITLITNKVLKKKVTPMKTVFVTVVCTNILNPKYTKLKLSTKRMKQKVKYYLVSFIILLYNNIFY